MYIIQQSDGLFADTDYEKACAFSEYFSSVFITNNNTLPDFNPSYNDNFGAFTCHVRDILKVISKLKNSSFLGPGGYSVYFLKKFLAHTAKSLCKL